MFDISRGRAFPALPRGPMRAKDWQSWFVSPSAQGYLRQGCFCSFSPSRTGPFEGPATVMPPALPGDTYCFLSSRAERREHGTHPVTRDALGNRQPLAAHQHPLDRRDHMGGSAITCTGTNAGPGAAGPRDVPARFRLQYHSVHGRTPCRRAKRAWGSPLARHCATSRVIRTAVVGRAITHPPHIGSVGVRQ